MRTMLFFLAVAVAVAVVSCAEPSSPPDESTVVSAVYCNQPIKVVCHPWYPGGDNNYCHETCLAFDGVSGYCPESTQTEWDWCEFHPNDPNYACSGVYPRRIHHCVTQSQSLTPTLD